MEVILLERIGKLGQMGETVRVKDGYARNFLLPKGKALRATAANKAKFEGMKVELETRNLALKSEAEKVGAKLNGQSFPIIRQAAETGQLYGSVSARDLADIMTKAGFAVDRSQVALNAPIKAIGQHKVPIALHPEIEVSITVNVARSMDEAERLARGEDVITRREEGEEAERETAIQAAEAFFEPGVANAQKSDEDAPKGEAEPAEAEALEKPAKAEKKARAPKAEKKKS